MNNRQDPLRKLARSVKYQNLFARANDLGCIHLFDNTSDFTKIQTEFLYWLAVYNRLYQDLSLGQKFLSQEVIDNDLLCDCYLIWEQRIKHQEELEKLKSPNMPKTSSTSRKQIDHNSPIPSVVFSKG